MTPANKFTTHFSVNRYVIRDTNPNSLDKAWITFDDSSAGYPYNVELLKAKLFLTEEECKRYIHVFQQSETNSMGSNYWIVMKWVNVEASFERV